MPPPQVERIARHLLAVLDPDGGDTFDPDAYDRREVSLTTDATGKYSVTTPGSVVIQAAGLFPGNKKPANAPAPQPVFKVK